MTLRLAVVTTGRQDWGILRSSCRVLREDPAFDLRLLVGGMHCSARFGLTERQVEEDGFLPHERLAWIPDDGVASVQAQAGAAVSMAGDAFARQAPDAALVVGDRFETAAVALAATVASVPLVHLHGGEETQGAFDDALRHAITKLSHLHLTSHWRHAARVIAMGEDPATVHVVGAPGLDNLHRPDLPGRGELESFLKIELRPPVVVVTVQPATLGADPASEAAAVVTAMDDVEGTYVITLPNTDPGHERVCAALAAAGARPGRVAVPALGDRRFWGLLRLADAILGNSSSALVEAPVLALPAVNVGDRQKGRLRAASVIDVVSEGPAVADALRRALSPGFRAGIQGMESPFGDGRSAPRIREILRRWHPPRPPVKAAREPL